MEQDIQVNDEAIDGTGTQNNQTTSTNAPDDQDALIAMLKQDLEAERAKSSDLDDKLKRTLAESMNMRKRMDK